jgi:uncharacterized protein (DUF1499 family)
MTSTKRSARLPGAVAAIALVLLAVAAVLVIGAGPAYRTGLLPLGDAFGTLRNGVYTALAAAAAGVLTVLLALMSRRWRPAIAGALVVVCAAGLASVPYTHWQRAQTVPAIHDITTDTVDPPAFQALVAARERTPNAVDYPGEQVARQQRAAYPDIVALRLRVPLPRVRDAAVAEVRARGWHLAAATDSVIEATATTRWFGFEDDVVIRLREEDGHVRVDMRSASRVGRSDVGANAARIRDFLGALEQGVVD